MTLSQINSVEVSVSLEKARNLYTQHGGEDEDGNPRYCMLAGPPFKVSLEYLSYCTALEAMQKDSDDPYDWLELMGMALYMEPIFDQVKDFSGKFLPDMKDPFRPARTSDSSKIASSLDSPTQS
jgi:hypothetical protein